jgi:hypothetical protein
MRKDQQSGDMEVALTPKVQETPAIVNPPRAVAIQRASGLPSVGTDALSFEGSSESRGRLLDPVRAELDDAERSRAAGSRRRMTADDLDRVAR